jgi:RNA polymerase primary sigma factor
MERTIEFVPHAEFECAEFPDALQRLRPASLDELPPYQRSAPGRAFVSGLVQTPLLSRDEEVYWFTWMNFLKFRAECNRRLLDLARPDMTLVARIDTDLGDALRARNHIIQGNLRLIVALAKKLAVSLEQMSDLISEGMTPLIRSVELFDISLGNRFSTYATWAVRNQMLRWLKRVRLSPECSLGEDAPSLENLPDLRHRTEIAESIPQLQLIAVERLLSSLSERDRSVIAARFGLDGQPCGQSLAEIAGQLRLSKERVRQIVLISLSKLRGGMTYDEFEAIS